MGAERWVRFATADERDRALKFIAPLGENFVVEAKILTREYIAVVWIDVLESGYDSDASADGDAVSCFGIEFGYSFGGDQSDELSMLLIRELVKRFKAIQIGADSVGWYSDSGWSDRGARSAFSRYGEHVTWVEWAKAWRADWSHTVMMAQKSKLDEEYARETMKWISIMETAVMTAFADLDKGAS